MKYDWFENCVKGMLGLFLFMIVINAVLYLGGQIYGDQEAFTKEYGGYVFPAVVIAWFAWLDHKYDLF